MHYRTWLGAVCALILAVNPAGAAYVIGGPGYGNAHRVKFLYPCEALTIPGDFNHWDEFLNRGRADREGISEVTFDIPAGQYSYLILTNYDYWSVDFTNHETTGPADKKRSLLRVPPVPAWQFSPTQFACGVLGCMLAGMAMARRERIYASRKFTLLFAIAVGGLCYGVRLDAMAFKPALDDEGIYVPLAHKLAFDMADGGWPAVINEQDVSEHPRLVPMLFMSAIRLSQSVGDPVRELLASRQVSALLSSGVALLLAFWWPLGALMWCFHGVVVHFTSAALFEATVSFFSVLSIVAFWRAGEEYENGRHAQLWFVISAVACGMAISSKYLAAPVPLTIIVLFFIRIARADHHRRTREIAMLAVFAAVALIAMIISDPYLWTTELPSRIIGRLRFHQSYSHGNDVVSAHFPWYAQLMWLWKSDGGWAQHLFDRAVLLVGAIGAGFLMRKRNVFAVPAFVTLVFLFIWPTKWAQYSVTLVPWLAIAADQLILQLQPRRSTDEIQV